MSTPFPPNPPGRLDTPKSAISAVAKKQIQELLSVGFKLPDGTAASNYLGTAQARTRQIGEELNKEGGIPLMLEAHRIVGATLGAVTARELEAAWDGIGNWAG